MKPLAAIALAAALAAVATAAAAGDDDAKPASSPSGCAVAPNLMTIEPALVRGAARLRQRAAMTIVALGSSSTQGVGATTPEASYPSRLQVELRARFRDVDIRVVNRGIGGEEVAQMLPRLDRDVFAEHPDLVIWQLGTNAVLRHDDVAYEEALIDRGIARFRENGIDLVLMDMQYAPRVIARPAWAAMEQIIANVAKSTRIGLFRRFEIMRRWQAAKQDGASLMIGPDGLHMTDRGYGCLAADLADALAWNWGSHRPDAPRPDGARIAAVAGRPRASASFEVQTR